MVLNGRLTDNVRMDNAVMHSEIRAVPVERLVTERELLVPLPSLWASIDRSVTRKFHRLVCVRFASARYSVPVALIGAQVQLRVDHDRSPAILSGPGEGELLAEYRLIAPGEASIHDARYGAPPGASGAVRPRTAPEKAFCALGPTAQALLTGAAAAGDPALSPELVELRLQRTANGPS